MPKQFVTVGAFIGSTLMALSLAGSYRTPANTSKHLAGLNLAEVDNLVILGKSAFSEGRYQDSRNAFWAAATAAMRAGSPKRAATNWSNAGFAAVSAMQYRAALEDLTRARRTAEVAGEMTALSYTLNNLATLYLQIGAAENALRVSDDALARPATYADPGTRGKLLFHKAQALTVLGRFPEAEPIFHRALDQITDGTDLSDLARAWAGLGGYYLDAGRYENAEAALSESLRIVRTHRLKAAASVLTILGKLRGKQGDKVTAEYFFREALDSHETQTPLWSIYYERGLFRLETGSIAPALADFRESRRLAVQMRADIVPADQDRVAVENRVSRIFEGLVDAGNRLAISKSDRSLVNETFDAAEQDRLWSLRSLVPEANDWRSRLTPHYWELLVRFQAAERSSLAQPSAANQRQAADLQLELQREEASAGVALTPGRDENGAKSPSIYVRDILDPDSVLLSFSITGRASWLWLVERQQMSVYSLPARDQLEREISDFTNALRKGTDSTLIGKQLYGSLFGKVPAALLARKRWLLELDGPLYDLPFAALPVNSGAAHGQPEYLIERAALQSIPGALLIQQATIQTRGAFVGIGDPVFNDADPRWKGKTSMLAAKSTVILPRLPNTAAEVMACARAWGSDSQLLTGSRANVGGVELAISNSPAVIHFATHVLQSTDRFGSGLIALGLDPQGAIGLMGPDDIAARRVSGSLVVMNGCHSAQGKALPGSGLMGLTRAWIGAGASAVLSTRWDVPDESAQLLMVNFYRSLHNSPDGNPAIALRESQLSALRSKGPERQPSHWAGYFLLSRIS